MNSTRTRGQSRSRNRTRTASNQRARARCACSTQRRMLPFRPGRSAERTTRLRGRQVLRVAITNHRTAPEDMDFLVSEVLRIGRSVEM